MGVGGGGGRGRKTGKFRMEFKKEIILKLDVGEENCASFGKKGKRILHIRKISLL